MSDHAAEPFTPAEARLAARMHQWSELGVVAIDAADIARRAATGSHVGHGLPARPWFRVGSRRMIVGLLALLLMAAALALAAATVLQTTPSDAYRAVVTRPVDGGVDVVLVSADGRERVLRQVTVEALAIDPRYVLGSGGSVNQHGWLELSAYGDGPDRTGLERWGLEILIDLADHAKAPIILPANGFVSGRWGPDGRYALFCTESTEPPNCGQPMGTRANVDAPGAVRVFDPDLGTTSEIIVPMVQVFGGGPEIFWTADGSGFLGHDGTEWGVTPLDGGPFRPGAPRLLTRELDLDVEHGSVYRSRLGDPGSWKVPGGDLGFASTTLVDAQLSADGEAVWQLLDDPTGSSARALLARLTGPGTVESVRAYELPAPAGGLTLSPDDTFVAIGLQGPPDPACPECGTPMWEGFVLAPIGAADAMVTAGPTMDGDPVGLVPAVIADAWPGG